MSASVTESTIFLNDTVKQITSKINKSFSGGKDNIEEHRKFGANLSVDVPYQFLEFFLESDEEYKEIGEKYEKGELLSSEVKKRCIEVLNELISEWKERRAKVTDEDVEKFMKIRPIDPKSSVVPPPPPKEEAKN